MSAIAGDAADAGDAGTAGTAGTAADALNRVTWAFDKCLFFGAERLYKRKIISTGSYGKVWLYTTDNNKSFAVKTFEDDESYWEEVEAIESLNNFAKDCVTLPAVYMNENKNETGVTGPKVIVMPRLIQPTLTSSQWFHIIQDIFAMVQCLRVNNLFYTDLKPENLLFQNNSTKQTQYQVYLGDLGGINTLDKDYYITSFAREMQDSNIHGNRVHVYNLREDSWQTQARRKSCEDWWCSIYLGPITQSCAELAQKFDGWGRSLDIKPAGTVRDALRTNEQYAYLLKRRILEAIQCKEILALVRNKCDITPAFTTFCERFERAPFSISYQDIVLEPFAIT